MKSINRSSKSNRLYIGIDIGGTNIQASLVHESGIIICREKVTTSRDCKPEAIIAQIELAIENVMQHYGVTADDVTAVGIAVPGVVDPDKGYVAITPNLPLSGVKLGPQLEEKFNLPIILGNDGNLGALGEAWLGAARKSKSVVYICVGTGIGSGLFLRRKLWRGFRESAGEIGHMIMQIDGPKCGCGNSGCLEALASRTAMERDLRQAITSGRKSILSDLAAGDLRLIRSGMLRKALEANDELTLEVVRRAAKVLGYACLNVRHLIDPKSIILGGGVIEACGDYILPIIDEIIKHDPMIGVREGANILFSALGDDAVVLGAVAAARRLVGRNPFEKRYRIAPVYPVISNVRDGQITIGEKICTRDVFVPVNGKTKKRDEMQAQNTAGYPHVIGLKEVESICKGGPAILIVVAGKNCQIEITEDARRYLAQRAIEFEILPTAKAVKRYNKSKERKAALIHVTC